jgi:hypothetical protein
MSFAWRFSLLLILLGALSSVGRAQNAIVYYDHRPGSSTMDSRLQFQLPEDEASFRRNGPPPRFYVPKGQKACFVVENSNPVLYVYSVGAKVLTVGTPADLAPIFAALQQVLGVEVASALEAVGRQADSLRAGRAPEEGEVEYYAALVEDLVSRLRSMQQLKLDSDNEVSFESSVASVAAAYSDAQKANEIATQYFQTLPDRDKFIITLLREHQLDAWQSIGGIQKEFQDASEVVNDRLCVTVDDQRLQVILSVKAKFVPLEGQEIQRPVGNTLVSFEVDPVPTSTFVVAPGAMLSMFVSEQKRYSVEDGVVIESNDNSPRFLLGVFAMARTLRVPWLWGAIGVSSGGQGVPDLFFGLVSRFGSSALGTQMSLGVGLALAYVPVDLERGAVGEPLPGDIDDVSQIVRRGLRPGLSVSFAITGLELGG